MTINVPIELAKGHGGDQFAAGGAKYAETFEILGGLKPTDTALDMGCGPGRMAIGIGERFGWTNRLIGFDVRKVDIDFCQAKITEAHPNFVFHHLNVHNPLYNPKGTMQPADVRFPADDGAIDFAFATSLFTHLYTVDTDRYIRETARVLRRGGTLLSSWFLLDDVTDEATASQAPVRFQFTTRRDDGSYDAEGRSPCDAVAHRLDRIRDVMKSVGLSFELHRGAWAVGRRFNSRHNQDVVVSRKA